MGSRGHLPSPPDSCRSVNPIRTRGTDYATHITTERIPRIFRPSAGSDKVAFFCTQQNYQVFILHFKKSNFSHSSGEIKCGLRMLPYSFQYPYYFVLQVWKVRKVVTYINFYLLDKNFFNSYIYFASLFLLNFVYSKETTRIRRYLPIYFDITE